MPGFTKTGEVVIEAGLTDEGDLTWKAHHDGMNVLEVIGGLVVVGMRLVLKMAAGADEEGEEL